MSRLKAVRPFVHVDSTPPAATPKAAKPADDPATPRSASPGKDLSMRPRSHTWLSRLSMGSSAASVPSPDASETASLGTLATTVSPTSSEHGADDCALHPATAAPPALQIPIPDLPELEDTSVSRHRVVQVPGLHEMEDPSAARVWLDAELGKVDPQAHFDPAHEAAYDRWATQKLRRAPALRAAPDSPATSAATAWPDAGSQRFLRLVHAECSNTEWKWLQKLMAHNPQQRQAILNWVHGIFSTPAQWTPDEPITSWRWKTDVHARLDERRLHDVPEDKPFKPHKLKRERTKLRAADAMTAIGRKLHMPRLREEGEWMKASLTYNRFLSPGLPPMPDGVKALEADSA